MEQTRGWKEKWKAFVTNPSRCGLIVNAESTLLT